MIKIGPLQRGAFAVIAGAAATFALVGAAANAGMANWRDAGLLAGFAAWLGYLIALRWARFVEVTAKGLRYRNWLLVRVLPWEAIDRFGVRRAAMRGSRSWLVVAHPHRRLPVTLRATDQPGSYRDRPSRGELAARDLAATLDDLRRRNVMG